MSWIGGVADPPACSTLDRNRAKNPCLLCSAAAYCCGAVGPRPIAALLGRFLPRLGPLVHSSGPFFLSEFISARHSGAREARASMCHCTSENPFLRLPIWSMDFGLAPRGAPRNDGSLIRRRMG